MGSTLIQFTCTLIAVDVPTDTLPCSRVRKPPWNFTTDSGWIRAEDPSASRSATDPGLVSSTSPEKTAVESATSTPFTHTPPLLCTIAEPVSAASSDSGNRTTIPQQRKLRNAHTLIAK